MCEWHRDLFRDGGEVKRSFCSTDPVLERRKKQNWGGGTRKFFDVGGKRILSQEQNIGQLLTFPAAVSFSTV